MINRTTGFLVRCGNVYRIEGTACDIAVKQLLSDRQYIGHVMKTDMSIADNVTVSGQLQSQFQYPCQLLFCIVKA